MSRSKSPGPRADHKKKMTKEQVQLAMVKKKECEERALKIVYQLIEPNIDSVWLLENLKHISRSHMEDVIEERAITKVCGYVLCQKPITVVIKQTYHISLKDKKVYDMTKRKNFCSSGCFAASNYLLEQMLTSPLWIREKEEIPEFHVLSEGMKINHTKIKSSQGVVDISSTKPITVNEAQSEKQEKYARKDLSNPSEEEKNKTGLDESVRQELSKEIDSFLFEAMKLINSKKEESHENFADSVSNQLKKSDMCSSKYNEDCITGKFQQEVHVEEKCLESLCSKLSKKINIDSEVDRNISNQNEIKQEKNIEFNESCKSSTTQNTQSECSNFEKVDVSEPKLCCDKINGNNRNSKKNFIDSSSKEKKFPTNINKKPEKLNHSDKKLREKKSSNLNLTAKIEQSFKEWVSDETVQFLFGDDSYKQKVIENVEHQEKYSILCEKLDKLQFQDEQEDAEILEKPSLNPLPHFSVLKEEGKRLELKVQSFYEGKTTFEDTTESVTEKEKTCEGDAVLPLMENHAPQALRRKIFLEKLDKVLPELLKTLTGSNYQYKSIYLNYTSCKSSIVKALVRTFTLSPKNIIFKSVEWTLVGLVLIKMLSILDPTLHNLLNTKQATMFVSMILTSYQLDINYLNFFIDSLNPNMNLR